MEVATETAEAETEATAEAETAAGTEDQGQDLELLREGSDDHLPTDPCPRAGTENLCYTRPFDVFALTPLTPSHP